MPDSSDLKTYTLRVFPGSGFSLASIECELRHAFIFSELIEWKVTTGDEDPNVVIVVRETLDRLFELREALAKPPICAAMDFRLGTSTIRQNPDAWGASAQTTNYFVQQETGNLCTTIASQSVSPSEDNTLRIHDVLFAMLEHRDPEFPEGIEIEVLPSGLRIQVVDGQIQKTGIIPRRYFDQIRSMLGEYAEEIPERLFRCGLCKKVHAKKDVILCDGCDTPTCAGCIAQTDGEMLCTACREVDAEEEENA